MAEKYSTIASFEFAADVQILKSRLEAEGIPVFLKDENIINTDPLISLAVGGVKLQVLQADAVRARAIYDDIRSYAVDDTGALIICPNCKATRSELFYSRKGIFYKLFPFLEPKKYRCLKCNMITRPQK